MFTSNILRFGLQKPWKHTLQYYIGTICSYHKTIFYPSSLSKILSHNGTLFAIFHYSIEQDKLLVIIRMVRPLYKSMMYKATLIVLRLVSTPPASKLEECVDAICYCYHKTEELKRKGINLKSFVITLFIYSCASKRLANPRCLLKTNSIINY